MYVDTLTSSAAPRLEDPDGHRDRALDALRQEALRGNMTYYNVTCNILQYNACMI